MGTYTGSITPKTGGNYTIDSKDKEFSYRITPKQASVVWRGSKSFVYDGKSHSIVDNASVTGIIDTDTDVRLDIVGDSEKIAAGQYTARAVLRGDGSGNYEITDKSDIYKWEIVKVDLPNDDDEAEAAAQAAFNGTYAGDVPSAKSVKAKAAKKSFTVKWKKLKKKQLKSFTNVEIQYCSDGAFNRSTTAVRVVGKGKKSVKVKGLAKGSVYYVRVRNIRNAGGTKYVSAWSGVKRVKVK